MIPSLNSGVAEGELCPKATNSLALELLRRSNCRDKDTLPLNIFKNVWRVWGRAPMAYHRGAPVTWLAYGLEGVSFLNGLC